MDDQFIDIFFYGLFMDPEVLAGHGIPPRRPRRASAESFALRIGQRATLVPTPGARAYGMVYSLTRSEIERLYSQPGLAAYRPERLAVRILDGSRATAICYNLDAAPAPAEPNEGYAARLRDVLTRLDFPSEYVAGIAATVVDQNR